MALLDDYYKQKEKQKSKKKGILDDFYKEREKRARVALVPAQKEELRKEGLAVSTRKDRATPSFTGSILRDILKVPATLLARPGQALAAAKGFTPEEQTLKSSYLGDIETSRNSKDVIKDVGRGIELASYGVGVGAGRKALASTGKESAKVIAKRLAAEGAASGFVGSAGRAITEDKKGLDALKDVGIGTLAGGLAGGALGYIGGRIAGKTLSAQERAAERAFGKGQTYKVPEAGTPPSSYRDPNTKLLAPVPKDLTYEPIKQTTTPNVKTKNPTKKELATGYEPYTPESDLPEIQYDAYTGEKLNTPDSVSSTPSPSAVGNTPDDIRIDKVKIQEDTDWLNRVEARANDTDVRGFEQSSKRYQERLIEDEDALIDYAMGGGAEDPKLPRTSAYKLLARDADLSNNTDLTEKLSFSNVKRASGQELVGNKILEDQTTSDLLEASRRKRAAKLGITENQLAAEEAKLFKELSEEVNKKVSYTEKDLLEMLQDFIC